MSTELIKTIATRYARMPASVNYTTDDLFASFTHELTHYWAIRKGFADNPAYTEWLSTEAREWFEGLRHEVEPFKHSYKDDEVASTARPKPVHIKPVPIKKQKHKNDCTTTIIINEQGVWKRIPLEEYRANFKGVKTGEWVHLETKEGKRRRKLQKR